MRARSNGQWIWTGAVIALALAIAVVLGLAVLQVVAQTIAAS